MSLCLTPRIEAIAQQVTGRQKSLFADDMASVRSRLGDGITARRILVVGGAGSIGSATIMEILAFAPASLVVLDPCENNLAELVRSIRCRPGPFTGELLVEPLDYASPLTAAFLERQKPFDYVLSFAALKHVRSERDIFSLLRLLEVNLLKADRFLRILRQQGHGRGGVFFVSTDKAANPVSLMGASKRIMELLLWAHTRADAPASLLDGGVAPALPRITTTRFANVAFSDGSLPWSFLQRIEKRQPLAAPGDIRRFLVSPREAGQLCLLSAWIAASRHVLVPVLDPTDDLVSFTDIAVATLQAYSLEPAWYADEAQARHEVLSELARGRYPIMVTSSDTSGEKDIEEFVAKGEQDIDCGLKGARAILAPQVDIEPLREVLQQLDQAVSGGPLPDKDGLVRMLMRLVPELEHRETGLSLDGKM